MTVDLDSFPVSVRALDPDTLAEYRSAAWSIARRGGEGRVYVTDACAAVISADPRAFAALVHNLTRSPPPPPAAFLAALALSLIGCGAGLDLSHAVACRPNVYVEQGAHLTCAQAGMYYDDAQRVTGIDLGPALVLFTAGPPEPGAYGATRGSDIRVQANVGRTLIHEAYHLHDPSHCGWSRTHVPTFEVNLVAGQFYDECVHVTCGSTHNWTDTDGQIVGNLYECW